MKQGTFATKAIMIILLVGMLIYVGVYIIQAFQTPFETELVYLFTAEESISVNGYIVREEQVLPATTGLVEVLPAEGEQVGKDQTVAQMYQSQTALDQQKELDALSAQAEQLKLLASTSDDSVDKVRLDQEIVTQIISIRRSIGSQSYSHLTDQAQTLKNLVFKREYTSSQEGDVSSLISSLEGQITTLTAATANSSSAITVSQSGTFSGLVDGYESVLTPERILDITPSVLGALAPVSTDNQSIGKLVTSHTWYFATIITEDEADAFTLNRSVSVRLSRDFVTPFSMTVEYISEPENGQAVVVFSSKKYLSQVTLLRQAAADLVSASHTGLRIPKDAARVLEDGTTGVYCFSGLQAEFKKIEIIYEGETFFLVAEDVTNANALKSGDEILVVGTALYDGKVIS